MASRPVPISNTYVMGLCKVTPCTLPESACSPKVEKIRSKHDNATQVWKFRSEDNLT